MSKLEVPHHCPGCGQEVGNTPWCGRGATYECGSRFAGDPGFFNWAGITTVGLHRTAECHIVEAYAAIFPWVPERDGPDGKQLTLAQKIDILGQRFDQASQLVPETADVCDECQAQIPQLPAGSIANRHHAQSCSLYDGDQP